MKDIVFADGIFAIRSDRERAKIVLHLQLVRPPESFPLADIVETKLRKRPSVRIQLSNDL